MTIRTFATSTSAYCLNCMEPLGAGGTCSHCKSDVQPIPKVAHHLPPGTLLGEGRYLVGRALGQGGFGITYIGRDLKLDLRIAIKEYYPTLYVGRDCASSNWVKAQSHKAQKRLEAGRWRFLEEARVLAKFHNTPGIVDVRDFFEENGTVYIVMDYLEGETLKEYLQHSTMTADQAFTLTQPIMDALELVHAENVIHRDISPDNIMLCSNGTLCLMDFGAARDMDFSDQNSMSMVLKSGYAPEEQYRAKGELGPWTDIYAMCATIYRAITGVAPDESLQRLISDEMAWPSDMGVSISPTQEHVLRKGMAPKHEDRYQSIAELKRDLVLAIADGPGDEFEDESVDEPENVSLTHFQDNLPSKNNLAENESEIRSQTHPQDGIETPFQKRNPDQAERSRKKPLALVSIAAVCVAFALAALYLLTPAYTITFDTAGGDAIDPMSVNRTQSVEEPATPARDGFEFEGWYLDDDLTSKAEFPLKTNADTTLHAAWRKATASYRVEYLDASNNSEISGAKTVEGAEIGTKVTVKAPDVDGYLLESDRKTTLTISENEDENVAAFAYRKLVSYEVRYLDKASGSDVSPVKTVEGIAEGTQITETAPSIAGFTLQSEAEQTIALKRSSKKNIIVFYYEPEPIIPQNYTNNSGGKSSNNGSSGGSKKSNDDVIWAN